MAKKCFLPKNEGKLYVKINSQYLENVDSIMLQGVTINNNLSLDEYINGVVSKVTANWLYWGVPKVVHL